MLAGGCSCSPVTEIMEFTGRILLVYILGNTYTNFPAVTFDSEVDRLRLLVYAKPLDCVVVILRAASCSVLIPAIFSSRVSPIPIRSVLLNEMLRLELTPT